MMVSIALVQTTHEMPSELLQTHGPKDKAVAFRTSQIASLVHIQRVSWSLWSREGSVVQKILIVTLSPRNAIVDTVDTRVMLQQTNKDNLYSFVNDWGDAYKKKRL